MIVVFSPLEDKDATEQLTDTDNPVVTALVWLAIIIGASIFGSLIRKDGVDTGYYIFGAATIIVGIYYTSLLPIAVITILTALGSMLFTSTRE